MRAAALVVLTGVQGLSVSAPAMAGSHSASRDSRRNLTIKHTLTCLADFQQHIKMITIPLAEDTIHVAQTHGVFCFQKRSESKIDDKPGSLPYRELMTVVGAVNEDGHVVAAINDDKLQIASVPGHGDFTDMRMVADNGHLFEAHLDAARISRLSTDGEASPRDRMNLRRMLRVARFIERHIK